MTAIKAWMVDYEACLSSDHDTWQWRTYGVYTDETSKDRAYEMLTLSAQNYRNIRVVPLVEQPSRGLIATAIDYLEAFQRTCDSVEAQAVGMVISGLEDYLGEEPKL